MSTTFANEVVTAARVRYLRVRGLAGEIALVILDNGHDPTRLSTFGLGRAAGLRRGRGRRRPECVLATNTSALSVTEMASKLEHPERVVGLHFSNPVAVLPLLEVVRAEQTDDATLATAFAVGKTSKKSCVLVADAPAFVVNRLLTRFLGEVTASVEQGTPVAVADAHWTRWACR